MSKGNGTEQNNEKEQIQDNQVHNETPQQNDTENVEKPEVNNAESSEEKQLEERWLEQILEHPIKVLKKGGENEEDSFEIKTVGQIIDPEKDIWFSKQKKKPILKETGTRKLILESGATFPKIIPIEKQSDAPSRDREQVWIEATVLFPDGTTHEEYGIANRMNCPDNISQANLPIMARKRAMHRAFFRSDYIGLYDVYDENETLDVKNEKEQLEIRKLRDKLSQLDLKNKNLKNQLCKEIKTEDGELVWKINDMTKLVELSKNKNSSLVQFVAMLRMRHLNNKTKANG